MLKKRIIPCLDVKCGLVVKGVQFKKHQQVGDPIERAQYYAKNGADELVFYDISASLENRSIGLNWIENIRKVIDIPFCVAGGVRTLEQAENCLKHGADKISINTPAIENPHLINELATAFGSQCIVVGIDSLKTKNTSYICKNTGCADKMEILERTSISWAKEAVYRGAGEIVLNCMNQDGMQAGYDIEQLAEIQKQITVPLIASGGAGKKEDFKQVFKQAHIDGALAASVFHSGSLTIPELKSWLYSENIEVRR